MNSILMKAVVDCSAFLALSEDSAIDPEVAVAQLEQLSSTLKLLTETDRAAFVDYVRSLAKDETDAKRADFLQQLPQDIGLIP